MKHLLITIALFSISYLHVFGQNTVVGLIQTETDEPIQSVEVPPTNTDILGNYLFQDPVIPFIISPSKNDGSLNGVNVCDLIEIRKHVLDIESLDSPYKIIAADVNETGEVTTLDLVLITRVLLGIVSDFAPNSSWRFVDAAYVFPVPSHPFTTSFPESISINSLNGQFEADFIGVKIGDVNGSAIGSYPSTTIPDTDVLFFEFANEALTPQNEYTVNFTAVDFVEANGFQFTLSYDETKMEFIEINETAINNDVVESFYWNLVTPGIVTVLWTNTEGRSIPEGTIVFNAKFNILESTNLNTSLMFTSDYLPIASTNSQGCFGEIGSPSFTTSTDEVLTSLSNIVVFPNPTNGLFDLQLELSTMKNVQVELYNMIGHQVFSKEFNSKLINEQIDIQKLPKGIYFLSVNIDGSIATKRIMKS